MGPWPYASVPEAARLEEALDGMAARGLVSFTAVLRPDGRPEAMPDRVGLVELKHHFVVDPALPRPVLSAKTQRNLALASRHWRIEPLENGPETAELCARSYERLALRRQLNSITRMPPEHFERLLAIPGIRVLAAVDDHQVGAVIVAAQGAAETHMLHFCVETDSFKTCAGHLLMHTAILRWSEQGRVYLGGFPSGPDGEGVARFKRRWANRTTAVTMLTAVLDRQRYDALSEGRAGGGYFPAYRAPVAA